jgi:CheY-like chemotaxis protein
MMATSEHVILVVEDDDDIREALCEMLADEGYAVEVATNGAEALDRLRAMDAKPCLVLLDLMMPVMDGWTFLAEQRRDANLASVPVVVLSAARDLPTDVETIRKPLDPDRLLGAVHSRC